MLDRNMIRFVSYTKTILLAGCMTLVFCWFSFRILITGTWLIHTQTFLPWMYYFIIIYCC